LTNNIRYGIMVMESPSHSVKQNHDIREGVTALKQDYRIAAVEKCLDILEFLSRQRREMGLPEMSSALRMPKATLFRYLVTLEQRGYVRKTLASEKYSLGLRILDLSSRALDSLTFHEVALPHMKELLARFQETVNLAVLEGNHIVYVEILESPHTFKMSSRVGSREMPHSTALGKAILAFLPEQEVEHILKNTGLPRYTANTICSLPHLMQELATTRRRGYSIDNGENEEGARCVGAPIFDHRDDAIAAISISGPAVRSSAEEIEEMGAALLEASSHISQRIGHETRR
jgi:DNA-binding IclR family transcriptional regulator